jgi:5-methylcytosine-specific restriction endonuclease McrA
MGHDGGGRGRPLGGSSRSGLARTHVRFSVRPGWDDVRVDRNFLEECIEAGMSLPEIGRLADRSPGTVGYWVTKHGLQANGKARFSRKGPLDREQLRALVADGLTLREIAIELGTLINRVHYWIDKYELGPTGRGQRATAIRKAREAGVNELSLECPVHGETTFWVGKAAVRCRKCNSAGVAERRRKVKRLLVAEAGGCCQVCGFDRSQAALEFHHLNPATKSFGLGAAGVSRSIARARTEAAKCILLCANCHAQVEAGTLELPVQLLSPKAA